MKKVFAPFLLREKSHRPLVLLREKSPPPSFYSERKVTTPFIHREKSHHPFFHREKSHHRIKSHLPPLANGARVKFQLNPEISYEGRNGSGI